MLKKLVLGTVQFGLDYGINNKDGKPSTPEVFKILDRAYASGIKVLDTADAYGNSINLLGSYHTVSSNQFLVNTKFSKKNQSVSRQLQNALSGLCINTVNVYFFHSYQDFISSPELSDELLVLKEKQLINKIGLSIYGNDQLEIAIDSELIDVIQVPYNLLENHFQKGDLLKRAKQKKKEVQVRSIFLQGLFFMNVDSLPLKLKVLAPYIEEIQTISRDHQIPLQELALKYAMGQDYIDQVLIGVDSYSHLIENLVSLESTRQLPPDIKERINNIAVVEKSFLHPTNWHT